MSLFCRVWQGLDQWCNYCVLEENTLVENIEWIMYINPTFWSFFWFFTDKKKDVLPIFSSYKIHYRLCKGKGACASPCIKSSIDRSHWCIQKTSIAMDSVVHTDFVKNTGVGAARGLGQNKCNEWVSPEKFQKWFWQWLLLIFTVKFLFFYN